MDQNKENSIYLHLATLFGVGRTPLMPGSAACIVAAVLYVLIRDPFVMAIFTLVATVIAFLVSGPAEAALGQKDHKHIVIDDFAGQLIAYLFIPFSWKLVFIGFFLFRMFDMLKVFPANLIEKYPGAAGVVGDDVMAGIYAAVVLHIAVRIVGG